MPTMFSKDKLIPHLKHSAVGASLRWCRFEDTFHASGLMVSSIPGLLPPSGGRAPASGKYTIGKAAQNICGGPNHNCATFNLTGLLYINMCVRV